MGIHFASIAGSRAALAAGDCVPATGKLTKTTKTA
jgi:hypothetical protein